MADEAKFPFYLPDDLMSNILTRLPIKSLLVCTSVCKSWNSLIKSAAFFSSHLNHTISSRQENDSDLCLLQLCTLPVSSGTDTFSLRLKDHELSEYDRLHFPFAPDEIGHQVVASCYGLVYFMHGRFYGGRHSYEWILWNPAIRKMLVITERQNSKAIEAVGLGFDSRTSDFKLLSIIREPHRDKNLSVNLYSLKANSWKRLPDLDYVSMNERFMYREMAFVNGVLHFVGLPSRFREPRFMILGFDLADEVFHEMMLPDCMANYFSCHFLSKCGESLSVLWLKHFSILDMEIWVMKEYGVEGSWTKVSAVRLDSSLDRRDLSISGLVFKDDSHVLLSLGSYHYGNSVGRIYSHDLKSQETKEIEVDGKHAFHYLGNYVESLVLLDGANDRPSDIESNDCFMCNNAGSPGLLGERNHHHFEIESDDGDDASGSGSSSDADYVCDHCDSGDEETADLEQDSVESDSNFHASDDSGA